MLIGALLLTYLTVFRLLLLNILLLLILFRHLVELATLPDFGQEEVLVVSGPSTYRCSFHNQWQAALDLLEPSEGHLMLGEGS